MAVGGTGVSVDVGAVAHRRVGQRVARLDLVAVHERHDRDRLGAGRAHRPARRRASPRARSRRRHPTRHAGRPSRRTGSPTGCGRRAASQVSRGMSAIDTRSTRSSLEAGIVRSALAAGGQAGSASRVGEVTLEC